MRLRAARLTQWALLLTAGAAAAAAQTSTPPPLFQAAPPAQPAPSAGDEKAELSRALADVGNSPVDFIRALEAHLARYPDTPHRSEIEAAIVKAAMEARDDKRIARYGPGVLDRQTTGGDPLTLDRVTRVLLDSTDKATLERALGLARRLETLMREVAGHPEAAGDSARDRARMVDEVERLTARALTYQARALGNLGRYDEAVAAAIKSYDRAPAAEAAAETAKWLAASGHEWEAIPHYADAFTIADPKATDAERLHDRRRLAELYQKVKGTQAGLGDLVLEAWDRTQALLADRRARLRALDPNAQVSDPLDFTVTGVKGGKLELKTLRGKVVVMDFWATWCGPCRIQHPLYEEVKRNFAGNAAVVFLSINTDEDRSQVAEFVSGQKWNPASVYFDDGLETVLRVSSIPTTVIFGKNGQVASRMNGFLPERFVEMLSERIRSTLSAE